MLLRNSILVVTATLAALCGAHDALAQGATGLIGTFSKP
jgi:hypothetical protein